MNIVASVAAAVCRGRNAAAATNRRASAVASLSSATTTLSAHHHPDPGQQIFGQAKHTLFAAVRNNCQSSRAYATAVITSSSSGSLSRSTDANTRHDRLKNDTDYLLYDIPVGEMIYQDRSLAHRVMVAWQRTNSVDGAYLVQNILERLVEEDEAGNHRIADISARLYSIALKAWAYSGDEYCGQRAEAILNRMEERWKKYSNFSPSHRDFEKARPDTRCYNLTLHALSQCREADATVRAEQLVGKMEKMSKADPNSTVRPQTSTYNNLMNTYSSRIGEYGIGQRAEDILLGMAEKNKDGNFSIHPDTLSFNIVLKAWLNSGESGYESAIRAEQLLRLMAKLEQSGHDYVRPDAISFLTCLQAYAKADDGKNGSEVINHVEGLIDLMEETGASGDDVTRCFNAALSIIGKGGVDDATSRAEQLIDRMQKSKTLHVQPTAFQTKVSMLDVTARGGSDAVTAAENILNDVIKDRTMQAHSVSEDKNSDVLLNDSISLGKLVKIVLESGEKDCVKRADIMLAKMEEVSQQEPTCAPYKSHYHMVIDAYSKINDNGSAIDAFKLLKRQIQCFDEGNHRSKPDGFVYSSVIFQLARSNEPGVEEKAHEVLMMMIHQVEQDNADVVPITVDYNCVIGMLAKAGTRSATEKALSLFKQLEAEAESGNANVQPDIVTYSSVVNALVRTRDKRAPEIAMDLLQRAKVNEVATDSAFFRQMIRALCTSRELKDLDKAYDVLVHTNDSSEQDSGVTGGARDVISNTTSTCNMVIRAYADSPAKGTKAATKAQSVLVDLVSKYRKGEIVALPDKYGFEAVIAAWSYSSDALAMRNVEKLLRLMKELHCQGCPNVAPDAQTITRAMPVYSNFARRKGVVDRGQKRFDLIPDPDTKLYHSLLNLVAKSSEPKKHQRAKDILEKMRAAIPSIDVGTYNIVLNACAFTSREEDKEGALAVAKEIFSQMTSRDCVSYGSYMKTIRKCVAHEDDEREATIRQLVQECKEQGYLGHLVLKELKFEYGEPKLWDVLGVKGEHDVPMEWRSRAKKPPRRRS